MCVYIELGRQKHAHTGKVKFHLGGGGSTQSCTELAVTRVENFSDFCTLNFFHVTSESHPSTDWPLDSPRRRSSDQVV